MALTSGKPDISCMVVYLICFALSALYLNWAFRLRENKYLWMKQSFRDGEVVAKSVFIKAKYIDGGIPMVRTVGTQANDKWIYRVEDKKKLKKLPPDCIVILNQRARETLVPKKLFW